jgi:hypothetical protein
MVISYHLLDDGLISDILSPLEPGLGFLFDVSLFLLESKVFSKHQQIQCHDLYPSFLAV